jgi:hypothetical protein
MPVFLLTPELAADAQQRAAYNAKQVGTAVSGSSTGVSDACSDAGAAQRTALSVIWCTHSLLVSSISK